MNIDARISVGLPNHPKTKKLHKRGGSDATWGLVCLFLWVSQNKPDGDLSGMSDEDIEIAAGWAGEEGAFVKMLADVRFLDGEQGAWAVHDWEEHNPWAAGANKRSQKARDAASAKWGSEAKTAGQTRSERLAEARKKGTHTAEEWAAMVELFDSKCVRCDEPGEVVKDHILPIYQGGSDSADNLQPLCRRCNSSKGAESTDFRAERLPDWKERLRNAYETPANACSDASPKPFQPSIQANHSKPKAADAAAIETLVAEGVPRQVAVDWVAVRKTKKLAWTETALDGVKREAANAGMTFVQAVTVSCESGWGGFKASWLQPKVNGSQPARAPEKTKSLAEMGLA